MEEPEKEPNYDELDDGDFLQRQKCTFVI